MYMNPNKELYEEIQEVTNTMGDLTIWWCNNQESFGDVDVSEDNIEALRDLVKDARGILKDIDPLRARDC